MIKLEIGQILEFFQPAHFGERVIDKGTRVRIGAIMPEMGEDSLTIVILGSLTPEALTLPRHIVTLNSLPVPPQT